MRVGYGPIDLSRKLRRGKYEPLTLGQGRLLYRVAGLAIPSESMPTGVRRSSKKNQKKKPKNSFKSKR
jgi:hypothetical protein